MSIVWQMEGGGVRVVTGLRGFWASTVGKKAVMAVTGFVLFGFVVMHMVGNLKVYYGPEKFNAYAEFLRTMGAPILAHAQALWAFRIVLLVAVVLHIVSAYQLTRISWAARPVAYKRKEPIQAGYASRTMRWGGVIIALFVIYHILNFTTGDIGYAPGQFNQHDVYRNVVLGFSIWWISLSYIAAMVALGLHMYHGVWSMFQTLGLNNPRLNALWRTVAIVFTLAVVIGNVSIPLAVLTGLVR